MTESFRLRTSIPNLVLSAFFVCVGVVGSVCVISLVFTFGAGLLSEPKPGEMAGSQMALFFLMMLALTPVAFAFLHGAWVSLRPASPHVLLDADSLTLYVPNLLSQPLRIPKSDVQGISIGRNAFRQFMNEPSRGNPVRLSRYEEVPDIRIDLRSPLVFEHVKRALNVHLLKSFLLRPPKTGSSTSTIWLASKDFGDATDLLQEWAANSVPFRNP